jgi:pimeloyl-ACP methyl ester carboxylesterase
VSANQHYFSDYASREIAATGHYPMLERPDEFNLLLTETLAELLRT